MIIKFIFEWINTISWHNFLWQAIPSIYYSLRKTVFSQTWIAVKFENFKGMAPGSFSGIELEEHVFVHITVSMDNFENL